MKKATLKSIIILSISFVIAFVAIFFTGFSGAIFPSGKGSGTNAEVKTVAEVGEILDTMPEASQYMSETGVTDPAFRPFTLVERSAYSSSSYSSSSSSSQSYDNSLSRSLSMFYTKNGVYYKSVGFSTYESYREYETSKKSKTKTVNNSTLDFDIDVCITGGVGYIKFNRYNVVTESKTYVDGTLITEDDSKPNYMKDMQNIMYNCLKDNYGKWIKVESKSSSLSEAEPDSIDAMVAYACDMLGSSLLEELVETTESNNESIAKITRYLKQYDNPLAFTKTGDLYTMTTAGVKSFMSDFGASLSENESINSDNCFKVDMSDKTSPLIRVGLYIHGDGGSLSLDDTMEVTNVNNTILPEVPDTDRTFYNVLGGDIKKYLEENPKAIK